MADWNRITELECLFPDNHQDLEAKYEENFEKYSTYMGNGVYQWKGIYSNDTRELFLMGILHSEKIEYPKR